MTEKKLMIDTDVLIDYLREHPLAVEFLRSAMIESVCYISMITVAELFAGVREVHERKILTHFIQEFQMAPMNFVIAERGGLYRRDFGKSHGVGLADAIIAATAEHLEVDEFITLNKKHYPMLKAIRVPYQKHR
jgi:predicted nucleic acid-binding protein